ncbi:MAG: hypothetical protein R6W75_08220 [Smithellaceae bacterium]
MKKTKNGREDWIMRLAKSKPSRSAVSDQGHLLTLLEPYQETGQVFYNKTQFHHILHVEKIRSERTQRPLLLMLLDISATLNGTENQETPLRIQSAIHPALREADIRGWYHENKTIGIIFTEISSIDTCSIEAIISKIHKCFREELDPELISKISIFFHIYPRTS